MITFVDEKGTEYSALVAYSVTNAVNGELSVKGTIYTNDKVLHGIGRGWRFRLDDEYFRITYAKPNDTGRQIEVEFDAVHQFFYDMSKSMVYTTLNGSKPFETYLQAIFSNSGYTYNLETTIGSIRKENFGNKSRLSLFNDIIKAAGLEFSVRGHVIRILKRVGTDLSTIVRKDFNMNELKIEKDINSFVTYQRGIGAWKDDEDHSKGRYETSYESPLSAIYGRIEADPVVDERYKDTGKLLERLKENVDKSYKVSVEIDMEDLSQAGYRISRPNPGDYIMAINETLGFRQKVRIVSFTSEYDVGGNLISRKVVCNDIGTVQRATSEISHLSRMLTDSTEGSERALQTATRALVSADGKNTNYFGDVKPLDVPKGTLRKGDRLFLTVGDKKQLYFWNGAEWELEPTEFDHEKFDMEFNRKSQEIKKVIQENRQKAEEALRNAGASSLLAQEAKQISEQARADITNLQASSQNALNQIESFKTQYGTKLNEVKSTADGLLIKMGAVETYISKDGQRQEALRKYTREESARQATAVRELVTRDYVGKATYQEDVRGIERRFEAITNPKNGSIATQIANYKTAVDGRFADITSLIANKANQTDFQRVQETSKLYERIIGSNENDISNKVARMAMTNQLFQVEVAKAAKGGRNYIRGIKEMRVASGSWDSGTFRGSGSGSVRTIEVSDSPVSGFNKALRIISSDPKGQIGVAQDGFEIMPGAYTMSVWIKGSAGQRVRLQNYWWSDDSTGISPEFILKDDKWTYLTFSSERKKAGKLSIGYVYLVNGAKGSYLDILAPQLEEGSIATSARPALEDTEEAVRSVQSQLAGSFAFQNLTSAGSIVSQINATNNQILIEAEKIRLKGKTLADQFTAIDGYFKRLFVGEGAFAKLNAEIIASKTITADKLVMDMAMARMFVSSDIFTDTLAAKEAFINKLRSVVVTATLLEGYKGRIGGFQIGTHEKDSSVYWITGQNQFSVGMSNGSGHWSQTALWVNWGNNWGYPGDYAWFVKHTGQMYCYNRAEFWNTPIIHGDLKVTGHIFYNNENSGKSGYWIYSSKYSNFEPSNNYLYLYYSGSGYDWIPMNKEISDRRYKHNIEASTVSGLDVVENLKTYSYRKQYDGRIEDIACGIMAQDVQKYAPEAFYENPDGAYSYSTFALVPYLIKAIQELNQKIEKLEKTA